MRIFHLMLVLGLAISAHGGGPLVDIFGCFSFQDLLKELFTTTVETYFWFPNCLPGGFWDKIQCTIGKCYCAFVDTGSQIPGTIENEDYEGMIEGCPVLLSSDTDPCKPHQSTLPCSKVYSRYVYDESREECVLKSGICYGFDTRDACRKKCVNQRFDRCNFDRDTGKSCNSQSPSTRYYHNQDTQRCIPFRFKGCGGNSNNYASKWECFRQCEERVEESTLLTISGTQYVAILPKWLVLREKFVPDVNNNISDRKYREIENYIKRLSKVNKERGKVAPPEGAGDDADPKKICRLPPKTGVCRGLFTRWYFDYKNNKCRQFIYGGCDSNFNNFRNNTHCERFCNAPATPHEEVVSNPFLNGGGNSVNEKDEDARNLNLEEKQQFESDERSVSVLIP